jgi:hypothetical protein
MELDADMLQEPELLPNNEDGADMEGESLPYW